MKLKTAAKLEMAFRIMSFILFFPFWFVRCILKWIFTALIWPFEKLLDLDIKLCWKVGNALLKKSDEVKNGQICNQTIIRSETARRANIMWENEKKSRIGLKKK